MKLFCKHLAAAAGLFALATLSQPKCAAQCGLGGMIKPGASLQLRPNLPGLRLIPAPAQNVSDGREHENEEPSIVGFWHVIFTAKTMNGAPIPDTVIDDALIVWHSDGTEIMNSGRPPQDGSFCMGVWKQTDRLTYALNHFAIGNQYTPGTANGFVGDPMGPTRLVESATLARDGNHYSGKFTLTAHDTAGQVTVQFTGVMSSTRITLDTTVADIR